MKTCSEWLSPPFQTLAPNSKLNRWDKKLWGTTCRLPFCKKIARPDPNFFKDCRTSLTKFCEISYIAFELNLSYTNFVSDAVEDSFGVKFAGVLLWDDFCWRIFMASSWAGLVNVFSVSNCGNWQLNKIGYFRARFYALRKTAWFRSRSF